MLADLDRHSALISRAVNDDSELQQMLDEARATAKDHQKRLPQRFPALLEQAAEEAQALLFRQ